MVCKRSFTVSSAISLNSINERLLLRMAICMIGGGIGIRFRYRRWVAVTGKVALGTRYLITYIVRRRLHIHGQLKLYRDTAAALLLTLLNERIPGIPLIFCSNGSVIWFMITSRSLRDKIR